MGAFVGLCVATLMALCGWRLATAVTTVYIEDCQPGKYFWREEKPEEFYACLTLPHKAVKMQCSLGSYMCNTGPQMFQPCLCKGKKPKLSVNKQSDAKSNRLNSLKNAQGYKQELDEEFDQHGMASTELPKLDDPSSHIGENDVSSLTSSGKGSGVPSLPSNGCPDDPFKLVTNAHMYRGTPTDGSLIKCQRKCISETNCMGVDYNTVTEQCFILNLGEKETIRYGLNYHKEINHYRRTHCYSTVAPYGKMDSATQPMESADVTPAPTASPFTNTPSPNPRTASAGQTVPSNTARPTTQSPIRTTSSSSRQTPTRPPPTTQSPGRTTSSGGGTPTPTRPSTTQPRPSSTPSPTATRPPFDNNAGDNDVPMRDAPTTTTTFPDSGCPYTYQKYIATSHPFGIKLHYEKDMESCKNWCLKYAFCKAVDFDSSDNTCHYLREILSDQVTTNFDVTHFRKIECSPPLKCWSEDKFVKNESDLAVSADNTAQTACHGLCFVSQSFTITGTSIQRGCMTVTDPAMADIPNGCSVDSTLMTIVCFCDTARCNGLSIDGLASMMMYLPLDGDFTDHSGIGRDGSVPAGKTAPEFSCLDKAVNCSAVFNGDTCVAVAGLSQVLWGSPDVTTSNFVPTLTIAIWFKRATTSNAVQIQGMFGNSLDTTPPSWQIIAESINHFIGAGIATTSNSGLNDYPYIHAPNDEWHLAVMTYSGQQDEQEEVFSLLKLYIDGVPQMGNARADKGEIGVRSQAVTVGCVQDMQGFIGFLDEARLFNMVLDHYDIKALQIMRDSSSYW